MIYDKKSKRNGIQMLIKIDIISTYLISHNIFGEYDFINIIQYACDKILTNK